MNWKQAWELTHSQLHPAEASSVKVYGSEFNIEGYKLMLEVLGDAGLVRAGDPGAVLRGKIERMYRGMLVLTFGGGTNEVQRDIIAMAGSACRTTRSRSDGLTVDDDQKALRELAGEILRGEATQERLREIEQGEERVDLGLWKQLAKANLLGVAIAEAHGGNGMGLSDLCVLLEEIGHTTAPLPPSRPWCSARGHRAIRERRAAAEVAPRCGLRRHPAQCLPGRGRPVPRWWRPATARAFASAGAACWFPTPTWRSAS